MHYFRTQLGAFAFLSNPSPLKNHWDRKGESTVFSWSRAVASSFQLCGLPVLFRWCPRGFPIGGSVASQWLPSGVPVASLWPPCGIPAIRRRPACNFSISRYIPPISRPYPAPYPACFFSISRYISFVERKYQYSFSKGIRRDIEKKQAGYGAGYGRDMGGI